VEKGRPWLGRLAAQGERGVAAVPATVLLRIRHNPLFGYMADRIDAFTGGGLATAGATSSIDGSPAYFQDD
jgi:hypothetical protein